jgi:uncharacterized protein involved in high-affinity Fe2+ transport
MNKMRSQLRWVLAAAVGCALLLSGCSSIATRSVLASAEAKASMEAGHEQFPVGEAKKFDVVQVAALYSQPADMEPAGMGLSAAEADLHLEAAVTALEGNNLGFATGAWIPYLTVEYQITGPDGKVSKGTFMPMTGNCGQHYGANVKLGKAGTYEITYLVHNPTENGFVVHSDKTTGVEGRFWDAPLAATWSFNYLPREW